MIPTDEPEKSFEEETDELYDEAVKLVVEMQSASISMLQRRFRIGYSRAARIIDQMEARGVVGPPDGSRPRQVLISNINE
jgi:S-DNA-T family DNA segregation ATPase FtsK/SpoIIIE